MPGIDPEGFIKRLQPLHDLHTGAVRSTDDVDKILTLMSTFSKKLVSKCIYINTLKASQSSVIDLFMERGGWNLVFGWTNDAIAHKNYLLLKEILQLLLMAPVTVPRLKSSRLPIVVKTFSKDCKDEETKMICKQVVSRWIKIAKTEEKTTNKQPQKLLPPPSAHSPLQIAQQPNHIQLIDPTSGIVGDGGGDLGFVNKHHLLNIDPSSIGVTRDADGGHQNTMDLNLSHSELAGIDFNLDILNMKVAEGHTLDDVMVEGIEGQIPIQQQQQLYRVGDMNSKITAKKNVGVPISVIQHTPAPIQIHHQQPIQHKPQQQQQHIILPEQIGPQTRVIQHHIQRTQLGPTTATATATATNVKNAPQAVSQQQPQHYQIVQNQQPHPLIKIKDPQQQQQQKIHVPGSQEQLSPPHHNVVAQQSHDVPDARGLIKMISNERKVQIETPVYKTQGVIKTYSKTNSLSYSVSSITKSSSSDGHHSKKTYYSYFHSSSTSKAAFLAAQAKNDERLNNKIKSQKAQLKKRQKELDKQQREKDQQTLKKLNLIPFSTSSTTSSVRGSSESGGSSSKIPKFPRRSISSFAGANGIAGSNGSSRTLHKTMRVSRSPDKSKEKYCFALHEEKKIDEDSTAGSFTLQGNNGKLKSALVLMRPRNRKKKFVRWREEDELKMIHFFEMDKTAWVNATKQKDFTTLNHNETAIEGSDLKRRGGEETNLGKPSRMVKISGEIPPPPYHERNFQMYLVDQHHHLSAQHRDDLPPQRQFSHQMAPNHVSFPTEISDHDPWNSGFGVPPTWATPQTDMHFGQFGVQNAFADAGMNPMGEGIPPPVAAAFPPNAFVPPPPPLAMMNRPPPGARPQASGIMDFEMGNIQIDGNYRGGNSCGSSRFNVKKRNNNSFYGGSQEHEGGSGRSSSREKDHLNDLCFLREHHKGGSDFNYREHSKIQHDREKSSSSSNNKDFRGSGRNIISILINFIYSY